MRQALRMPLWVLLLAMLLMDQVYAVDAAWLLRYAEMLGELYQALPVPRNWWQRWAVRKLIGWIDQEKEIALALARFETNIVMM